MFHLIVTACLLSSPSCESANPVTCTTERLCEEHAIPIAVEHMPSEGQCMLFGQMMLAQPGGWKDKHPDLVIKGIKCVESVDFLPPKEQEV